MKPHNFNAPGLTGSAARVINRRQHTAQFAGKTLVGCLGCGKALDGDDAYRDHLKVVNG